MPRSIFNCSPFYDQTRFPRMEIVAKRHRKNMNKWVWDNIMMKMKHTWLKRQIEEQKYKDMLLQFKTDKVAAKLIEYNGVDDGNLPKRNTSGPNVEFVAVCEYATPAQFDNRIYHSLQGGRPDLSCIGIPCEIKGSSFENTAMVFRPGRGFSGPKSTYKAPVLIGVYDETEDVVYLCGMATPAVLNQYIDDNLIITDDFDGINNKSGFWGYEHLDPIPRTVQELKDYVKKNTVI